MPGDFATSVEPQSNVGDLSPEEWLTQALALSPCPFCGGDGARLSSRGGSDCVVCDDCDAQGPVFDETLLAIKAWNTRASRGPSVGESSPQA